MGPVVGIGRSHGSRGPAGRGCTGSSWRAWRAGRCWPRSRRPRPRRRRRTSRRWFGNLGGVNASQSSSVVAVDPHDPTKLVAVWVDNDPTIAGGHGQRSSAASWRRRIRSTAARTGSRCWASRPTDDIPVDPELLDPTTSGPTVPYTVRDESQPGVRRQRQLLHPDRVSQFPHGRRLVQRRGGAAEVRLQRVHAVGGGFHHQRADPGSLLASARRSEPEGHLPVALLGHQRPGGRPHDDGGRQPGDHPRRRDSQPDTFSGNVYVSWTSIDVNTAIPILDFNPNRIKVEVSSDGGNNFSPLTIADINSQTARPRRQRPDDRARRARRRSRSARGGSRARAARRGDAGIPGGQVAVGWDDFGDSQVMANTDLRRPRFLVRRCSRVPRSSRKGPQHGFQDPGLHLQRHRPVDPRRHGQHRRLQRSVPGPDPGRPQRR